MASPVAAGYLLNRAQNQLSRTLSDEPGEIAELSRRRAVTNLNMKRVGREAELQEPELMQAEMYKKAANRPFTVGRLVGQGENAENTLEHLLYKEKEGKSLLDEFGDVLGADLQTSGDGPVYISRKTGNVLTDAEVSPYWPEMQSMYKTSISVNRRIRAAIENAKDDKEKARWKEIKNSPETKIKVAQELIRAGEPFASVNPNVRSNLERHYKNIEKWEGQIQKRLDREQKEAERKGREKLYGERTAAMYRSKAPKKDKINYDALVKQANTLAKITDEFGKESIDPVRSAEIIRLGNYLLENKKAKDGGVAAADAIEIINSAEAYAENEVAQLGISETGKAGKVNVDYDRYFQMYKEDYKNQQLGGKPNPKLYPGKRIFNPQTGVREISDGQKWIQIDSSNREVRGYR